MFEAGTQPVPAFLAAAIELVEDWLTAHGRVMPAGPKAEIVGQLYRIIAEDAEAGEPRLDARRAEQFLRLVVDNGGMK